MDDIKIQRINELSKKERNGETLTPEEKDEQTALRREYIDAVKRNMRNQLSGIKKQ